MDPILVYIGSKFSIKELGFSTFEFLKV